MKTQDLVARVARSFEQKVKEKLSPRLKSFYLVGSYILGKISDQRPDINFLLVFDEFTGPQGYLSVGDLASITFIAQNDVGEGETATLRLLSKNGAVKPVDLTTPSAMTKSTTYLYP